MTRLLASIRSVEEARLALEGGADIIDLKEPAQGALGRLPDATIRAILAATAGKRPVSATIGDLELVPESVAAAVRAMAENGVDIVKFGIFSGNAPATIRALAAPAREGIRLVAVLFGDRDPDFGLIPLCAEAGLLGVMLDTADKKAGPLTSCQDRDALARFVGEARRHGLLTGLAGSLREADIPLLRPLGPDYLGFRSALTEGSRDAPLDAEALARIAACCADRPGGTGDFLPPGPASKGRPGAAAALLHHPCGNSAATA